MPRRHLGVAIAIPEPYGTQLHDWRERLGDPDAAAVPPHVTLLPPTGLPEHDLPRVEEHLEQVAAEQVPFRLHLRGSATFRPVSPVVFVPLVQGSAECLVLEEQVRSGPLQRDLAFAYHPHVTVAHELTEAGLDRAFAALSSYEAVFEVSGLALYERGRDGAWRPLRVFPFAGAG